MQRRECLILFTRYPEPGTTKTRLIPCLEPDGAADLQRQMTEHIMTQILPLIDGRGVELEVRFEGGGEKLMRKWLGGAATYRPQTGEDIGLRMLAAFEDAAVRGSESIVVVGSDIPGINTALLERAFRHLAKGQLVLGPAKDGGYYLIGLPGKMVATIAPRLLMDMAWGTSSVLAETCRRLGRENIEAVLLATLEDVDRPQDLHVWERYRK